MRFNSHYELEGRHAFLGASKYHWIRYDLEKMKKIWENQFSSQKGTRIHKIAADLISESIRMKDDNQTLNAYINDAIRFRMSPEVVLKFSDNAFCTADAISFEKGVLRIHDLKTGVHPASFDQLLINAAYFCHEYKINPYDIEIILRLYQMDEVHEMIAEPSAVQVIIDKAKVFDPEIEEMKAVML